MNTAFLYTIAYTAIMGYYLKNMQALILSFTITPNSSAMSNITMSVEKHAKTALKSRLIPESGLFARSSDNGERASFFPRFFYLGLTLPLYTLITLPRLPADITHILARNGNGAFLAI